MRIPGWPPKWLARRCAQWLLHSHSCKRTQYGGSPRCPCERCDLARHLLEVTAP